MTDKLQIQETKTAPKITPRTSEVNGKKYTGWMLTYYERGRRIRKTFKTKPEAKRARGANRHRSTPDFSNSIIGFRAVLPPGQ